MFVVTCCLEGLKELIGEESEELMKLMTCRLSCVYSSINTLSDGLVKMPKSNKNASTLIISLK